MSAKTFTTRLIRDDDTVACGIRLPFNPKDVFGKVRAPVRVTVNRYTFRTTTCSMGGDYWIPVNKANRESAKIEAGDQIKVRMVLDGEPRVITPPADLAKALRDNPKAQAAWNKLSYTHRKEQVRAVEEAKRTQTRIRRIAKAVEMLAAIPERA